MEEIRQYFIRLTAAALACSAASEFFRGKGTPEVCGRILCGACMALAVLSPWISLRTADLHAYWNSLTDMSQEAVRSGENFARQELSQGIKQRCEAYILDKAEKLGVRITAEITLTEDDPPVPASVILSGSVSPYARSRLTQQISSDLGIPEEAQTWVP